MAASGLYIAKEYRASNLAVGHSITKREDDGNKSGEHISGANGCLKYRQKVVHTNNSSSECFMSAVQD